MIFVKSIEHIKLFYGQILNNTDFNNIAFCFDEAEGKLRGEVLGPLTLHLANQLSLQQNNSNHQIAPEESELIRCARGFVVNYGYYKNFAILTTGVGNAGTHQVSSHNTSPLPMAQQNAARRDFWLKSHYYLELLHETLQKNINLPSLSIFANSEACAIYNSLLCRNNNEVKAVVGEWGGFGVFLTLKPYLEKMQRELIAMLGNTIVSDFLDKRKNDTLSDIEKGLLLLLQNYMVWGAIETAVPFISLTASDSGNWVVTAPSADRYVFKPIDDKEKAALINHAKTEKNYYKNQILAFLAQNGSSFPQYTPPANNAPKAYFQETGFGGHLSV